ncbi:hypothetical protein [Candidatus Poriferisocius sp.]|uniref:hypothetical protein n=1 Tax=Candidatus Poriferisocius sp. TaxID=3101276 RepID=UPI003B023555
MDETADPGIEVSSGEAADRVAADLNERFGAGIGKADRLHLEQLLLDAMGDDRIVADAIAYRFGDHEEDDDGFHRWMATYLRALYAQYISTVQQPEVAETLVTLGI